MITCSRHSRRIVPITRFDVGALPGRVGRRDDLGHPHGPDLIHERVAEDAVPVPQQIARRRLPRKGFAELLGGPFRRRVWGHADVKNAAAVMSQYQEDIEDLEGMNAGR